MVDRYVRAGGRVHDLEWYGVLAAFRLGVLLEGTHARALQGLAPAEQGRWFHTLAEHLFTQAQELVAGAVLT